MKRTLKRLNRALEYPAYRQGWIANIAMCHMDTEDTYRERTGKKYLNRADRKIIANKAAEKFITLLAG